VNLRSANKIGPSLGLRIQPFVVVLASTDLDCEIGHKTFILAVWRRFEMLAEQVVYKLVLKNRVHVNHGSMVLQISSYLLHLRLFSVGKVVASFLYVRVALRHNWDFVAYCKLKACS
jgi:hypothetical protein